MMYQIEFGNWDPNHGLYKVPLDDWVKNMNGI
jgi:hypothetical protein